MLEGRQSTEVAFGLAELLTPAVPGSNHGSGVAELINYSSLLRLSGQWNKLIVYYPVLACGRLDLQVLEKTY